MNRFCRTGCLTLAAVMAFGLASCGGGGNSSSGTQSVVSMAQTEEAKEEVDFTNDEEITISFLTQDYVSAPMTTDQLVLAELAKRTKTNIEIQIVPSADYISKLNLLVGSNRLPDLVNVVTPDTVTKYLADGAFAPLNDAVNTYGKSMLKELDAIPGSIKNLRDDAGNLYFIPRIDTSALNTQYIINNKFLKQLNLPVPRTIDEFYNTLKAFKTLGNDVIPLGKGYATVLEVPVFNAYGTSYSLRWWYNGEEYHYAPYTQQEQVKAALQFLAKLYKEGLVDPEYYTLTEDDAVAKLNTGRVGVFNCWQDEIYGWTEGNELHPDCDYVPLYPLSSSYGQGIMGKREPLNWYFAVSAKSKYVDRIVKWFNYMCTDEGKTLMNWGIEGETYTVGTDGKKSFTDLIMKHEKGPIDGRRYYGMDHLFMPNVMDIESWEATVDPALPGIMKECEQYYYVTQPILVPTSEESNKLANIMTDIDKLVTTSYQQFICNQLNFNEDWDNFIKQMEKMGIEEAIKIKKAAFERWKAR